MKGEKRVFLREAVRLALRSGCLRAKNGAVLTRDGRCLVKAYNQVFPTNDFCQKRGCLRDKLRLGLGREAEKCRAVHAEAQAVALAAARGVSLKGATAWLTGQPCINCAKLLYSVGVKAVYFLDYHADQTGEIFLKRMGIECRRVNLPGDHPEERLRDLRGQTHLRV